MASAIRLPISSLGSFNGSALTLFNKHARLKLPVAEPTLQAIDAIKAKTTRVCPVPPRTKQTVKTPSKKKTAKKPEPAKKQKVGKKQPAKCRPDAA